jgi:hypothetical protein
VIAPSEALRGNVTALLEAIDLMVEQQRIRAALTLIYAGIDVIASLERRESERTGRAACLRWVDVFVLRDGRLPCTGPLITRLRVRLLRGALKQNCTSRPWHTPRLWAPVGALLHARCRILDPSLVVSVEGCEI